MVTCNTIVLLISPTSLMLTSHCDFFRESSFTHCRWRNVPVIVFHSDRARVSEDIPLSLVSYHCSFPSIYVHSVWSKVKCLEITSINHLSSLCLLIGSPLNKLKNVRKKWKVHIMLSQGPKWSSETACCVWLTIPNLKIFCLLLFCIKSSHSRSWNQWMFGDTH